MRASLSLLLTLVLLLAACSGTDESADSVDVDFRTGTPDEFLAELGSTGRPSVVNVWASWCLPCRSEAPLLRAAHQAHGAEIHFVGVVVEDDPDPAAAFVVEYGLDFEHWFDDDRRIPARLGGVGVPITYFVDGAGNVQSTHLGVLDERTLALGIDELLNS